MRNVSFIYTASSSDDSNAFITLRKKHIHESSTYDDNFYLTEIFKYLYEAYHGIASADRTKLKHNKEEEITDYIRRALQKNQTFALEGFIVNSEARNQDKVVGYYDLKFEHSNWLDQYFVLECKPIDTTKKRMDAYIHQTVKNKKDDGGLYRFLINKYATNKAFGGMLGYIISNKPEDVISNLKTKISSFQLVEKDVAFGSLTDPQLLETPIPKFKYSFQSNHTRIYKNRNISSIHIFHLFMDFT